MWSPKLYENGVNPVTNKIYVANIEVASVTVIDGAADHASALLKGNAPRAVAVNPLTNKIYIANCESASVK